MKKSKIVIVGLMGLFQTSLSVQAQMVMSQWQGEEIDPTLVSVYGSFRDQLSNYLDRAAIWDRSNDAWNVDRHHLVCHYLARAAGVIDVSNQLTAVKSLISVNTVVATKESERNMVGNYHQFTSGVSATYLGYCNASSPHYHERNWLHSRTHILNGLKRNFHDALIRVPEENRTHISFSSLIAQGANAALADMQAFGQSRPRNWRAAYDLCGKSKGALNALQALSQNYIPGESGQIATHSSIVSINNEVNQMTTAQAQARDHTGFINPFGTPSYSQISSALDLAYGCMDPSLNRPFFRNAIYGLQNIQQRVLSEAPAVRSESPLEEMHLTLPPSPPQALIQEQSIIAPGETPATGSSSEEGGAPAPETGTTTDAAGTITEESQIPPGATVTPAAIDSDHE